MQLDKENLRKLQSIQLEMLIEVDRICKKCGVKYNIIAGTLLGAVRHKGYIPWDDDADVALVREEYEKFKKACETELDKTRFIFQDHSNTDGYRWGYGKLRRKDTLYVRDNQSHMKYMQGVFIDIFPLDGVPNNYMCRCIHNFCCYCIRKMMWSEVGKVAETSRALRMWYGILSRVPEKLLFGTYEKLIKISNKKKTDMVRILTYPTPNRQFGYYRKWYENSSEIEFEGIKFDGIRDYDEYLTFKFGDYMTLPPENERTAKNTAMTVKLIDNNLIK